MLASNARIAVDPCELSIKINVQLNMVRSDFRLRFIWLTEY